MGKTSCLAASLSMLIHLICILLD